MDALRAVIVALSLLVVAIFYSDIVEDEAESPTQESGKTKKSNYKCPLLPMQVTFICYVC